MAHLQVSWGIDLFAVTTIGFGRLYVFVVLENVLEANPPNTGNKLGRSPHCGVLGSA